jgi:predicted DNA-binding transcriptional regulator AlpA
MTKRQPVAESPRPSLAKAANRPPAPYLVSDKQAAALLDVSRSTFRRYVAAGLLPQPVRIGSATRWRWADIEAAIAALGAA